MRLATAALACKATRMHGLMVQVAQPDELKIPFQDVVSRDVRVRGSMLASPTESEEMVKWIYKHGIIVLTKSFEGLESIGELVEAAERSQVRGKAAIVVDKSRVEKDEMRCFLWES